MTVSELIDYLGKFNPDEHVGFLITRLADDNTVFYPCKGYGFIKPKHIGYPAILLEVGEPKDAETIEKEMEGDDDIQ